MLGADDARPTQSHTPGGVNLQQPANCSRLITAGPVSSIPTDPGTSIPQIGGTTSSMPFTSAAPLPQVSSTAQMDGTTSSSSTPFASTIPLLTTTETVSMPITPTAMPTALPTSDILSPSNVGSVTTATLETSSLRAPTQNFPLTTAVVMETTHVSPSESVNNVVVTDPTPSDLNRAIIWGIVAASVLVATIAGGSVFILLIVMHRRWTHKTSYSAGTLETPNGRVSPLALGRYLCTHMTLTNPNHS